MGVLQGDGLPAVHLSYYQSKLGGVHYEEIPQTEGLRWVFRVK